MSKGRNPNDGKGRLGGRTKGTPNKASLKAKEIAEEMGVDPFRVLLHFCNRDWESLGYDHATVTKLTKDGSEIEVDVITPDHQLAAAKEATKYLQPQLKSIDMKSDAGGLLQALLLMPPEERQDKIKAYQERLKKK